MKINIFKKKPKRETKEEKRKRLVISKRKKVRPNVKRTA